MRFIVAVKATKDSESGMMPTEQMISEMGKFNEQLVEAGMMLDGAGLEPTSKGARVQFKDGRPTVERGPFANTEELISGFWLLKAKSVDEVVDWLKRAPFRNEQVEIRRIYDMEDYAPSDAMDRERELAREIDRQRAMA